MERPRSDGKTPATKCLGTCPPRPFAAQLPHSTASPGLTSQHPRPDHPLGPCSSPLWGADLRITPTCLPSRGRRTPEPVRGLCGGTPPPAGPRRASPTESERRRTGRLVGRNGLRRTERAGSGGTPAVWRLRAGRALGWRAGGAREAAEHKLEESRVGLQRAPSARVGRWRHRGSRTVTSRPGSSWKCLTQDRPAGSRGGMKNVVDVSPYFCTYLGFSITKT